MHGDTVMGGPLFWLLEVIQLLAFGLSLYVLVDSLRRPAAHFAGLPESRWTYAATQGVFLAAFALDQIPAVSAIAPWLGYISVLGAPFALAVQVAYLLRLVFPTQERLESRRAAEGPIRNGAPEPLDPAESTDTPSS